MTSIHDLAGTGDERFHLFLQAIAELQDKNRTSARTNGFTIQRVFGGNNNALYKIMTDKETLACKLCVEDGRQRAMREFGALNTLWNEGIDIAPQPILLDESKSFLPYPVVIYQWIEGNTLQAPFSRPHLEKILASYHKLHRVRPDTFSAFQLEAWFHWFNFDEYLHEIQELADDYTPWLTKHIPGGVSLVERLYFCIESCVVSVKESEIMPDQDHIPLRLMRVDPNIANAILGSDGQIRWVDWEYSGWGDPALDIAELRWHAALQPLGEEALHWLRLNYVPSFDDPNFEERLQVWDFILATRWPLQILRAFWSCYNGPDRERLSQVETSSLQYYLRLQYYIALAEAFFTEKK